MAKYLFAESIRGVVISRFSVFSSFPELLYILNSFLLNIPMFWLNAYMFGFSFSFISIDGSVS